MPRRDSSANKLRTRVAHEAARLIADHGISDFLVAKRKAAVSLGVVDKAALPRNSEIEQALHEIQRLFGGAGHAGSLAQMRHVALEVMAALDAFSPRLVGAAVSGATHPNAAIELHLFAEPSELVIMRLVDLNVDHSVAENRLRVRRERYEVFPACVFEADDFAVEVTVFPLTALRQAPLSPVDGKPMQRLSIAGVAKLLEA